MAWLQLVGCIRLRQLRTSNDKCNFLTQFDGSIPRCYLPYSPNAESKRSYGESGQFKWKSATELQGDYDEYKGKDGTMYPGSGYATDLPLSLVGARTVVEQLMNSRWLDQATRVIFVDINLFQPVPSKVLMIRMAVEFDISGKVTMRHNCWSYVGWSDVCTSHYCSVDTLNIRLTN